MKRLIWLLMVVWCSSLLHAQKMEKVVTDDGDTVSALVLPDFPMMQKIHHPAIYTKWWREVMKCARLKASSKYMDSINIYTLSVPTFRFENMPDYYLTGYSWPVNQTMFLIEDGMLDEVTVKHEMLHFLLYEHGISGHPIEYFTKRCHVM